MIEAHTSQWLREAPRRAAKARNRRHRIRMALASVGAFLGLSAGSVAVFQDAGMADPAITVTVGYITTTRVCNPRLGCHNTYTDHNVTITNGSGEGVLCNGWWTIDNGASVFQLSLAHNSVWSCVGDSGTVYLVTV